MSDPGYPAGVSLRELFINAGIPIRHKFTTGINHWKMMMYRGQNAVHFSAANFSNGSYSPSEPGGEYVVYVDEAIYFTTDPIVVQTFMKKYDDLWTNTSHYANLANITGPLTRNYPTYSGNQLDPELNFPPDEDYQDRLIARMRNETQQIDVAMFRITSGKVPDELIRRTEAGVQVRLITDRKQYRNTTYFWDSYNVDRMYMAGIAIKWNDASTDQDMHQKSVVLHSVDMAIFGSSNWTASSSDKQREHNYFTSKSWFVDWFKEQFIRKWDNQRVDGTAITPAQFINYTPGWPETPVNVSPANVALGVASSATLRWEGGWWAHKYDIYFGTTNPPPLVAQNFMPGAATAGVDSSKESFNPCAPPAPFVSVCPGGLAPGTTYYWRIRGKTMIGDGGGPFNAPARAISGPVWSFTTAGSAPALASPANLAASPVSPTRINLVWTDVGGESGYKIERKPGGASETAWAQIGTTAPNVVTYQDTNGLLAGTTYNYRVRASAPAGDSAYSNTVFVADAVTIDRSEPHHGRCLRPRRAIRERQLRHRYGARHQVQRRCGVPARSVHPARYQRRPTRTNRAAAAVRKAVRHAGGERRDSHRPALDERVDRDDGDLEQPAGRRGGHVGHGGGLGHDRAVVRDRRHDASAGAAGG